MTGLESELPLHGTRVLELGHIVAGPTASVILADLGADVIKVENPDGGDQARATGFGFVNTNRNKRSIAIDLKAPRGKEVFLELMRRPPPPLGGHTREVLAEAGFSENDIAALLAEKIAVQGEAK